MMKYRHRTEGSIYEVFSDVSMLMLATFIFLMVTVLITIRMQGMYKVPELKRTVAQQQRELDALRKAHKNLQSQLAEGGELDTERQIERIMNKAGLGGPQGRKDFDLFVEGLRQLPGNSLHLIVDATGSMHGVVNFLVPVLRLIALRADKHLDAITWFSNDQAKTLTGTLGAMLDDLVQGAPFVGSRETIGHALMHAANNAPLPSAYLIIGDEPSNDRIYYNAIKRPLFTLPIGKDDPDTDRAYQEMADQTKGKKLRLRFM